MDTPAKGVPYFETTGVGFRPTDPTSVPRPQTPFVFMVLPLKLMM
jgi:hypothetical protein